MTDIERLLAIEEIRSLCARRLRFMDTKQWDLYATIHTEDVVTDNFGGYPADRRPQGGGESGRASGNEMLTQMIRDLMEKPVPMTSCHHAHNPEIEMTSDTTARGTWAMEDRLWWQNGETEESLHGFGFYHERYEKIDGIWKISYRKLERTRVSHTPNFYDRLYA